MHLLLAINNETVIQRGAAGGRTGKPSVVETS